MPQPPSPPQTATGLQGPKRRILYVSLYEFIAIVFSGVIFMLIGQSWGDSGVMAIAASTTAIIWNVVFNQLFEYWESRQTVRGRSIGRRVAHAIGFEGGLGCILIPMMAWWFGISLWEASLLEGGLLLFFLIYTYVFNWGFDRLFGLPASAQ